MNHIGTLNEIRETCLASAKGRRDMATVVKRRSRKFNITVAQKEEDKASSVTAAIEAIAQVQQLQSEVALWKACAEKLAESLEGFVPSPNCSCHIKPPCGDCTEYGAAREDLAEFDALKGGK